MTAWPRVLVAGGSIGGLTAGLLLRDLGCDVHVFERSSAALEERGAGIVVLPITERYLVGRGGDADRPSLELSDWSYIDRTGAITHARPDHYRFSGWNTVYRALLEAFGPDRYHLDSEMTGFDRHEDGVTLHLGDGRRVDGDLLVCADGINSTARRILLPGVDPAYAGYVAWRGTVEQRRLSPAAQDVLADAMIYQVLPHSHVLVYAIPDPAGSSRPEDRIVNFVWYRSYPDDGAFDDLMTDVDGHRRHATLPPDAVRPDHLAELGATARRLLAPVLAEIVLGSPAPFVQAIFDLESPRMAFGRVVLMGDAAFGVRPHVAAGQAKACSDAWALADALGDAAGDVDAALAAWEPRQLGVGRATVARSRQMGVRSLVEDRMTPGDPDWRFGLYGEPG